jgi:hypothetical protein
MRKRFDKSPVIDAASNLRLVTMIQNHDEPYTEKEEEILEFGMARLELFRNGTTKVKKAKSLTPTVKNEVAFKEGDPLGWGRSETLVRATKEEVLAYVCERAKEPGVKKALRELRERKQSAAAPALGSFRSSKQGAARAKRALTRCCCCPRGVSSRTVAAAAPLGSLRFTRANKVLMLLPWVASLAQTKCCCFALSFLLGGAANPPSLSPSLFFGALVQVPVGH